MEISSSNVCRIKIPKTNKTFYLEIVKVFHTVLDINISDNERLLNLLESEIKQLRVYCQHLGVDIDERSFRLEGPIISSKNNNGYILNVKVSK